MQTIEDILRDGFSYHATESERLAGELETAAGAAMAPGQMKPLLRLANHTIGEHLGDWPRAAALAERVLDGRAPESVSATAWGELAVARFAAGDPAGAAQAEILYLTHAGDDLRAAYIDSKMTLALALIGSRRISEATPVYLAALSFARAGASSASDRAIAVASNNLANELLELETRTAEQMEIMQVASSAALEFWRRCGTWVNEERALYLEALVANAIGEADRALRFAEVALKLIAANGTAPVDEAFLQLACANALAKLGDVDGHRRALSLADTAAGGWDKAGLKAWFAGERAKISML